MHRAAGGPANEPNLFFDTGVFILDACVQLCWPVESVMGGSVSQDVLHEASNHEWMELQYKYRGREQLYTGI